MISSYWKIEEQIDKVSEMKTDYLLSRGWKSTCQNPKGYWLWQKEIKGVLYTITKDIAYEFECVLEDSEKVEE